MRFPAGLVPVAFAYLLLAVLPAPANARVFQKPLPYPVNALEPVISGESLDAHYRLHARYVERTNELIHGTILDKLPLQAIVLTAPYKSELVRGWVWWVYEPPASHIHSTHAHHHSTTIRSRPTITTPR